jgi:hypothetical protein
MPQTCSGSVISPCRVRSPRGLIALLVGLALSVGVSLGVQAATTWTVCASGCDYTRIKSAIAASTTLDGDTLAIGAGIYTEAGILVNKSLTLQGAGAATTIVQAASTKGTAPNRVFTIPSGVTATLQALTIRHGRAIFSEFMNGGGLWNEGTLTLLNSTVRDNDAGLSGGGLSNWGTLTLRNSTVSDNSSTGNGGGLANEGTLTLRNSTVSSNSAFVGGGLANFGTLTFTSSLVAHNTAGGSIVARGGGVLNAGKVTLTHSTVSGNSAPYGGGLSNEDGTLTLLNSTVSGNSAPYGGGLDNHAALTFTSSLVANNPDGGDCRTVYGAITSDGYNLDSDGSCQLTAPTDRPGTEPQLGPLQDNGGPILTHALLPGSPAIDVMPWGANGCGTILLSDQRWQARPQPAGGACDIGAYEVEVAGQALSAWVTGLAPSTAVCKNVTTGQEVTRSHPATPWNCEEAGLQVAAGDRVSMRVRGPVQQGATDVGGAVVGMVPSRGGCTNLTTGQQVTFQHMQGATAASCVAAGLVVLPGDHVQMDVQGAAESAGSALRDPDLSSCRPATRDIPRSSGVPQRSTAATRRLMEGPPCTSAPITPPA